MEERDACRDVLGDDFLRFEYLVARLPANVDRTAVYEAILTGRALLASHRALDTDWYDRRAGALENLRQAILRLRSTLEDGHERLSHTLTELPDKLVEPERVRHVNPTADTLLRPLEDAYERLTRADETDPNARRLWRVLLAPRPGPHRPSADWTTAADALLQDADVTGTMRRRLLRAAGLAATKNR